MKLADPYAVMSILYFKCLSPAGQSHQLFKEPICFCYWLVHKDMICSVQHKTHDNRRNKAEWVFPYLSLSASGKPERGHISLCVLEASLGAVTLPTSFRKYGEVLGYNVLQCAMALGLYDYTVPLPARRLPVLSSQPAWLVWWLLGDPPSASALNLSPGHPSVWTESDPTKGWTAGLQVEMQGKFAKRNPSSILNNSYKQTLREACHGLSESRLIKEDYKKIRNWHLTEKQSFIRSC